MDEEQYSLPDENDFFNRTGEFELDVYIKKLIIFHFSDFTPDVLASGVSVIVRNMSRLHSRSGFVCLSEDESLIDFVSSKISV